MYSPQTTCRQTFLLFFFNDTATTEIYTLSLHDALPISFFKIYREKVVLPHCRGPAMKTILRGDRKSGSAGMPRPISNAFFCLKKNLPSCADLTPTPSPTSSLFYPSLRL